MCGNLNRIPDPKLPKSKGRHGLRDCALDKPDGFGQTLQLPVIYLSVPVSQGTSATLSALTTDAWTVPCPWL
jgi:hypothetical protein